MSSSPERIAKITPSLALRKVRLVPPIPQSQIAANVGEVIPFRILRSHTIAHFVKGQGDHKEATLSLRLPTIRSGHPLAFHNATTTPALRNVNARSSPRIPQNHVLPPTSQIVRSPPRIPRSHAVAIFAKGQGQPLTLHKQR